MTKEKLLRWSGMAGLVSGVLLILLEIAFFGAFGDQPERVAAATSAWLVLLDLSLVAAYMGLLALIGLYARQTQESGGLGFAGFILASIGWVMNIGFLWAGAFIIPALTSAAPDFLDRVETDPPGIVAVGFISTFAIFAVGWVIFGIGSLKAGILPRAGTWLVILGALLSLVGSFVGLPLSGILFGLGLAMLGRWLWSERPSISAEV